MTTTGGSGLVPVIVLAMLAAMAGCHGNGTQEVDAAANGNLAPVSDNGGAAAVKHAPAPAQVYSAPARQTAPAPSYPAQSAQQYPQQDVGGRSSTAISCSSAAADILLSNSHGIPCSTAAAISRRTSDSTRRTSNRNTRTSRIKARATAVRTTRGRPGRRLRAPSLPHLYRNISSRHAPNRTTSGPRYWAYGQGRSTGSLGSGPPLPTPARYGLRVLDI